MIARNAGFIFITEMLSNHSSTHASGKLDGDVLKSFFGVTGDGKHMSYTYGHERIPENWYRRPVDYGLVELNLDVLEYVRRHPVLVSLLQYWLNVQS